MNKKLNDMSNVKLQKNVAAVKDAKGKTPYFCFTFDLNTMYAKPEQAWKAIQVVAESLGFSHPQQSVYVLDSNPEVEEKAFFIIKKFLRIISKMPWAKDAIRDAQVTFYKSVYDVTAFIKGYGSLEIESVMMAPDYNLRRAFAGGYEKYIQKAIEEGRINADAVIHDNAPHFGVVFDINCDDDKALLKEVYGEGKHLDIYRKVKKIMEDHGFYRIQGSTYISMTPAHKAEALNEIRSLLIRLRREYGFSDVVKSIKICEFYRKYDVTFLLKEQKVAAFNKCVKDVLKTLE